MEKELTEDSPCSSALMSASMDDWLQKIDEKMQHVSSQGPTGKVVGGKDNILMFVNGDAHINHGNKPSTSNESGDGGNDIVNGPDESEPSGRGTRKRKATPVKISSDLADKDLRNIAKQLGTEWECLATQLNCTAAEIQHLRLDALPRGSPNVHFDMLYKWKQRQSGGANLRKNLAHALREVGRNDLAIIIWNQGDDNESDNDIPSGSGDCKKSETTTNINGVTTKRCKCDDKKSSAAKKPDLRGWGKRKKNANIKPKTEATPEKNGPVKNGNGPKKEAPFYVKEKVVNLDKDISCSNGYKLVKMVFEDESAKIDAYSFYKNEEVYQTVFGQLQVGKWFCFRHFEVLPTGRDNFKRKTGHPYELKLSEGTEIKAVD